jgi:hypothetical protein
VTVTKIIPDEDISLMTRAEQPVYTFIVPGHRSPMTDHDVSVTRDKDRVLCWAYFSCRLGIGTSTMNEYLQGRNRCDRQNEGFVRE